MRIRVKAIEGWQSVARSVFWTRLTVSRKEKGVRLS